MNENTNQRETAATMTADYDRETMKAVYDYLRGDATEFTGDYDRLAALIDDNLAARDAVLCMMAIEDELTFEDVEDFTTHPHRADVGEKMGRGLNATFDGGHAMDAERFERSTRLMAALLEPGNTERSIETPCCVLAYLNWWENRHTEAKGYALTALKANPECRLAILVLIALAKNVNRV